MIVIEKITPATIDAVKQVCVTDEQVAFASTADAFLSDTSDSSHLHLIKYDERVVGFFKIDTAYSHQYEFCPADAIGLRSFVIDKSQQGKGIGKQAVRALFAYLPHHYARFNWIYLTVNARNLGAKACYEKGGFAETGKQYLGGPAGPQLIMRGRIG